MKPSKEFMLTTLGASMALASGITALATQNMPAPLAAGLLTFGIYMSFLTIFIIVKEGTAGRVFDFSEVRPAGDPISRAGRTTLMQP